MTATEELRSMLEERGVEWMDDSYAQLWCTVWHGQDGKQWRMTENQSGMLTELKAWQVTPEQAIAATLGGGECEITDNGPWGYPYVCGACGASFDADVNNGDFNYCPNCGRKVVER